MRSTGTKGPKSAVKQQATRTKIQIGQRFSQVGGPAAVWQVVTVYRDAQGVEHAALTNEARQRDRKTLSAAALQDRTRYRLV